VTAQLRRRGILLECATLGWNIVGVAVLAVAASATRSIALVGFGFDTLIEIAASTVVIWELSGTGEARRRRTLRLIGVAFLVLAVYLTAQSAYAIGAAHRAGHSTAGIAWTALTALVMFALAAGKATTGAALGDPVLRAESRITLVDGLLAVAVLAGLLLDGALHWWWADPTVGLMLAAYAAREAWTIARTDHIAPATSNGPYPTPDGGSSSARSMG
jgi:divalent metal cation (Fe/Co/Zn/Cd) transporter